MIATRSILVRSGLLAALVAFAAMFAPSALARDNWGVSIGFAGPGYSVGYSDCRHCGRGAWSAGFYGGGYGYHRPSYAGYYAYPSYSPRHYYSYPAYYPAYYPSYGYAYYDRPRHRSHRPPKRIVHQEVRYHESRHDRRDGYYSRDTYRNDRDYGRDRGYARANYYRD